MNLIKNSKILTLVIVIGILIVGCNKEKIEQNPVNVDKQENIFLESTDKVEKDREIKSNEEIDVNSVEWKVSNLKKYITDKTEEFTIIINGFSDAINSAQDSESQINILSDTIKYIDSIKTDVRPVLESLEGANDQPEYQATMHLSDAYTDLQAACSMGIKSLQAEEPFWQDDFKSEYEAMLREVDTDLAFIKNNLEYITD